MSTYSIEHIMLEYETSRMDVEKTLGHGLQHIQKLSQAQTVLSVEHLNLKTRMIDLEVEAKILREEVERLKAMLKKPPSGDASGRSE